MKTFLDDFIEKKNARSHQYIYLYEIDYNNDDTYEYFLSGTNQDVTLEGQLYTAFPIKHSNINEVSDGSDLNFNVQLSYRSETFGSEYVEEILYNNEGCVGGKIKIIGIFLDNLSEDDSLQETFTITSSSFNEQIVSFGLSTSYGNQTSQFPKRLFNTKFCPWKYNDQLFCHNPTVTIPKIIDGVSYNDYCDKTLEGPNGCKAHYNYTSDTDVELPFGGFPALK